MCRPSVQDHLQTALAYRTWGMSVVPVGADKRPECAWRWYRYRRPSDAEVGRLFTRSGRCRGAAVVLGRISGGLGCRDFDTEGGYRRWADRHPEYARTLPTVRTVRGYHVYHRSPYEHFRKLPEGDYRSDSGHYALLPGSVHPSGHVYEWHRWHPTPADFPLADPRTLGLLPDDTTADSEAPSQAAAEVNTALWTKGCERTLDCDDGDGYSPRLLEAVYRSLPGGPGERNSCLWLLAGELKALDATLTADEWRPAFGLWWSLASRVSRSKDRGQSWREFRTAYRNRKSPAGGFRRSLGNVSADPDPGVRLRAVCGHLSALSPDGCFFLSDRVAAEAVGLSRNAVRHHLRKAERAGWLVIVRRGTPSRTDRKGTTVYRLSPG